MFQRLPVSERTQVRFEFEGQTIVARAGDTVAAALLEAGQLVSRATPSEGAPRAPFCMMGICFECMMMIDGQTGRQACQTIITDGMHVARQQGAGSIRVDSRKPE